MTFSLIAFIVSYLGNDVYFLYVVSHFTLSLMDNLDIHLIINLNML